jgi:hypothetical protein
MQQQFVSFYVKGSAADPYRVLITATGKNLSTDCTCTAGSFGKACKHVVRILKNNAEAIVELNMDDFNRAQNWMTGSDVEMAIKELSKAEKEFEEAKKRVSKAKAALNRALED